MLDLDGNVVHHLLQGGSKAVVLAVSAGLKPSFLDGKAAKAFSFIVQHNAEHGSVPSPSDLESMFGQVAVATDLAPGFILQETFKRALFRRVAQGVESADTRLKANDPDGAYTALQACLTDAASANKKNKTPVSLFALGQGVLDEYALIESGAIGIPSPWPSVNKMTMGWWPGTNTWLTARPGAGKTMLELVCAEHAWKQRLNMDNPRVFRQLIISAEMLNLQMAERFFVIRSKLPYGNVVSATLGAFAKKKLDSVVKEHESQDGIWILDGSEGLTPERIQEAIDELEIDLLLIDAAYRIPWMPRAKDRFENLFRGAEIISGWTKRTWKNGKKIAALVSSQMNRTGAVKGGASKQTATALTDNIMWEADNVFAIEQTADMKADGKTALHTVKVRRMAEYKAKIMLGWDMIGMNFNELEGHHAAEAQPKDDKKFQDKGWHSKLASEDPGF